MENTMETTIRQKRCLILQKRRTGNLQPNGFSRLCAQVLAIKVEQFHDSMRRSYDILHIAHQYAADYVEAMNHFVLVTDLWQKISDPARHDEQPIDPAGSPTLQTNRSKKSAGGTRGWLTTRFQRLVSKRKMADFSQIAPLN